MESVAAVQSVRSLKPLCSHDANATYNRRLSGPEWESIGRSVSHSKPLTQVNQGKEITEDQRAWAGFGGTALGIRTQYRTDLE